MKRTKLNRQDAGFTLLEALTASAIFFIALVGASLLSVRAAQNAGDSVGQDQGSKLAAQLMEQQAMSGYTALTGRLGTTSGSQQAISGKSFTYDITLTDTSGPVGGGSPNLGVPSVRIDVKVRWRDSGLGGREVQYGTYVSP